MLSNMPLNAMNDCAAAIAQQGIINQFGIANNPVVAAALPTCPPAHIRTALPLRDPFEIAPCPQVHAWSGQQTNNAWLPGPGPPQPSINDVWLPTPPTLPPVCAAVPVSQCRPTNPSPGTVAAK